jgi:hypothetical protein
MCYLIHLSIPVACAAALETQRAPHVERESRSVSVSGAWYVTTTAESDSHAALPANARRTATTPTIWCLLLGVGEEWTSV